MPVATQSLIPYNQTVFTAVDGTTYKTQIDAGTAIVSNPAGLLYVYPNSPAGMSVLVDDAFTLPQVGVASPYLFNSASSPNVVSLVAPGSNSYYACVYWDISTATPGVSFGAASATPVPMVPDRLWQIPLAFVLLSSTTTSITATNIIDARQFLSPLLLTSFINGVLNPTFNCQGASEITMLYVLPASTTTLNFTNLRVGAKINLTVTNSTGAARVVTITASTPSGVAFDCNLVTNPSILTFTSVSFASASGFAYIANSLIVTGALKLYFKG